MQPPNYDPAFLLFNFLQNNDHPCPQCTYNLRNLLGNRCPECGEELVLRVNAAEPRQKLLITGLIGLSAGAGLNGLLLIYLFIRLMMRPSLGGGGFELRFAEINGGGLLVQGIALLIWLYLWRPIRRLPTAGRALLATACWGLSLLDILIFSFLIK